MNIILPVVIGILFMSGVYLLMSPYFLRLIFGFLVLSQAANLFLFAMGGVTYGESPIIPESARSLESGPEPLSQALILTAIVIGFGATAFLVVLARQGALAMRTDQSDEMREAER